MDTFAHMLTALSLLITALAALVSAMRNSARLAKVEKVVGDGAEIAHSTHQLVNGQREALLRVYATTARALAALSLRPEHEEAAVKAETALAQHIARQESVDARIKNGEK